MRRTIAELRAMSDELLYELQMLFGSAQTLRDDIQGPEKGSRPWAERMASFEAFAIHARVLEAFLWDKPSRRHPDDALAIDFFPDGVWEETRKRIQRSELDDLRDRAGHEIAHLSYKRLHETPETRKWKFDVIAGVVGQAFRLFLDKVDPSFLRDDFEKLLRASWPAYLNSPIAMSFPPNCDATPAISGATQSLADTSQLHQATFEEMLPDRRP